MGGREERTPKKKDCWVGVGEKSLEDESPSSDVQAKAIHKVKKQRPRHKAIFPIIQQTLDQDGPEHRISLPALGPLLSGLQRQLQKCPKAAGE